MSGAVAYSAPHDGRADRAAAEEEDMARMRETERRDDGVRGDQADGPILAADGADIRISARSSPARHPGPATPLHGGGVGSRRCRG